MVNAPESTTIQVMRAQLGAAYDRVEPAIQAEQAALLDSLQRPTDVAVAARAIDAEHWTVTVCTADCIGALSIIAGLFTAFHLDILSADIYTLTFPAQRTGSRPIGRGRWPGGRPPVSGPRPPSRRLLDIFTVRAPAPLDEQCWTRFRQDLGALVERLVNGGREQARDALIERVSAAFQAAGDGPTTLPPMTIELTNEPGQVTTRLSVRSADTSGFLFAFTNALAGFTINIERAEIRTNDGAADDTFWVTGIGSGQIVGHEHIHELRVATTLIKQFTHLLPRSPDPGQALRQFNALIAQMLSRPQWTAELANLESLDVLRTLADLMGVSRFLWEDFLRMQHENLFPVLLDQPALAAPRTAGELQANLLTEVATAADHGQQIERLNAFKDREMFRIDLRHITGRSDFEQFADELTALAEATVAVAADLAWTVVQRSLGTPRQPDGQPCPWTVCGLGKFGGRELGFGSDLELIFVHASEGTTTGPTPVQNSEFFERFVQTFRDEVRARQEGIFEIDLRLRPYGRQGRLASTLEGFGHYYSPSGAAEQFERMALVRLRPIAGDPALGQRVAALRDAFVFSGRPIDVENIRHLRRRQATELVPPGNVNAKYSPGGLTDAEYFVQAWQISVGHQDPRVRVTNTLEAIGRLIGGGHLRPDLGERARVSYQFLRQLIDALRVVRGNAKDLTIPPAHSREFDYLAHRLHYASGAALQTAITDRMASARALWRDGSPNPAAPQPT